MCVQGRIKLGAGSQQYEMIKAGVLVTVTSKILIYFLPWTK